MMNKLLEERLLEEAKHNYVLEETGKCNKLGSKLTKVADHLKMVEVYWGISNGGNADRMVDQLDRILRDLQEIRDNPFKG
jgi:hypothetical protein